MDLQEVVEVRNCPACGHQNQPGLEECAYCGADITRVPLVKELKTMPVVQEAANRPPPPPPSPEQQRKAASAAKLSSFFRAVRGWVLTLGVGVGAVFLLYAVSSKEPAGHSSHSQAAAVSGPAALDVFYTYKLRGGEDKGKTMRQFWTDYVQMYELSRAAGKPGMDIKVLSQASVSGGGLHEVFVFESVAGERRRAFPFSVNPASGEVAAARSCDFGPDIPAEYSVASCESVQDLFPEGL